MYLSGMEGLITESKNFAGLYSDYEAKIHEALLIKRHSPSLNKQCYASGASFLLNIY